MTRLPPPLARWAQELSGLPDELVTALAPWLGRLALAIGPLPGERHAPAGELDGVDGLSRRGSYERLLIGEWAIADDWPDEFLRRAASGEHLFTARAHRAPPAARRCVVLLSAGPAQLGALRLVHVAALVVLARRAAAGGAELAWGVLERPEDGLIDAVDAVSVDLLLDARTAAAIGADQVAAWQAQLGGAGERWVIGDEPVQAVAAALGAAALLVRDPFEPGVAAVDVEVVDHQAARPRAKVRLALPEPDEAARLVRDPFRRTVAPARVRTDAAAGFGALWFVAGGRRLALDLGDRIELWPVPSSPREPRGKPRQIARPGVHSDRTLVALGMRRRSLLELWWSAGSPEQLWLSGVRGGGAVPVALPQVVIDMMAGGRALARSTPGLLGFVQLGDAGQPPHLAIEGPCGTMLAAHPGAGTPVPTTLLGVDSDADEPSRPGTRDEGVGRAVKRGICDAEVVGAAITGQGLLFAQVGAGGVVELRLANQQGVRVVGRVARRGAGEVDVDPGVRWGCSIPMRRAWGPVAVRVDERSWEVLDAVAPMTVITSDSRVWGAVSQGGERWLLCDDADRRRLVMRGAQSVATPLPRASGVIVAAACGSVQPVVAWATEDEVVVYSLVWDAVLMRVVR